MNKVNYKKGLIISFVISILIMVILFGYISIFTITSNIVLISFFSLMTIFLIIIYIFLFKRVSKISKDNNHNKTNNTKNTIISLLFSLVSLSIFSFFAYEYVSENQKELIIEITDNVELSYDNSTWKIGDKIDEPYHEYKLNGRNIYGQSNIYIMPNLNSTVLINFKFQKKGIIASGGNIISQKELEINGIKFYTLDYSINTNETIIYISSFQFLTPDEKKFITLNTLGKNYEDNVKLLDDLMNRISIKD